MGCFVAQAGQIIVLPNLIGGLGIKRWTSSLKMDGCILQPLVPRICCKIILGVLGAIPGSLALVAPLTVLSSTTTTVIKPSTGIFSLKLETEALGGLVDAAFS